MPTLDELIASLMQQPQSSELSMGIERKRELISKEAMT